MNILGISAHYHDSAAALVIDGLPVCAVQEERLSRRKNDAGFPLLAIEWCLEHAGLAPDDLDAVVFYERPMLKFDRILTYALRAFPRSWRTVPTAMKSSLGDKVWVRGTISSYLGVPSRKILFTRHHQSHAAAAFLAAPTDRAAILTTDGVGEWATLTVGQGTRRTNGGTTITLPREVRFPHSLGMLYSAFTAYLGFAINEDEYKVMGLAGYGRPTLVDKVRRLIHQTADGAFALDLDYFEFHSTARRSYSSRFVDLFGPPRPAYEPIDLSSADGQRFADCAASVQCVLADTLVTLARSLHEETGLSDLCLGGGVALNGLANARILTESGFTRVFVPPAPGDAGCALGAALYADRIHFGSPDREIPDHPFWGPVVDGAELARLASEDGHVVDRCDNEDVLVRRTADDLAAGGVVGWMDGALELGPRALGHRSILASPAGTEMRDRLNREVKFRDEFRPFAPVVPIEAASLFRASGWRSPSRAFHVGGVHRTPRVARGSGRDHTRRRNDTAAGARPRDGAAALRAAPRVRSAHRSPGSAQHVVQSLRLADRESRGRRVLDVPALRDRCPGRRSDAGHEEGAWRKSGVT